MHPLLCLYHILYFADGDVILVARLDLHRSAPRVTVLLHLRACQEDFAHLGQDNAQLAGLGRLAHGLQFRRLAPG